MKTIPPLLLAFALGGTHACERVLEEQKNLHGPWKVTRAVHDGDEVLKDDLDQLDMIFDADTIRVKEGEKINDRFRFRLHLDHKPRGIDFQYLDGKKKGRVDRAIYQLDGNMLKICIQENPRGDRPKDFTARKGSERSLVILKKKIPPAE